MIYAVLDGGAVVARREIADWDNYPAHKRAARDEKGDGGPTLRLVVFEGDGPVETSIVETDRVRVVRSQPPLDVIKADFCVRVGADAEAVRLRFITPGAGMALTYQEKFAQAQGVQAMGAEAANALSTMDREAQFPTLAASVGIEAATLWECAQLVLQKYAEFAQLSLVIERTRLAGKKAISEASDAAAVHAAHEAITWPQR